VVEDGGDRSPMTKALTGHRTPKRRMMASLNEGLKQCHFLTWAPMSLQ
jgi:hypothetical protein